jgi:hypothetical protein
MHMDDAIYSVLDSIKDLRGQNNIVQVLKEAYPDLSGAFIAQYRNMIANASRPFIRRAVRGELLHPLPHCSEKRLGMLFA